MYMYMYMHMHMHMHMSCLLVEEVKGGRTGLMSGHGHALGLGGCGGGGCAGGGCGVGGGLLCVWLLLRLIIKDEYLLVKDEYLLIKDEYLLVVVVWPEAPILTFAVPADV